MKPPREYYALVKAQNCLCCGRAGPNEANHIRPPSNRQLGRFGIRSHSGKAGWFCIPLCSNCHKSFHSDREADWLESNVIGGAKYAYAIVAKNIWEYTWQDDQTPNT